MDSFTDEVRHAVALLQSIGVENLCLPIHHELSEDLLIPTCQNDHRKLNEEFLGRSTRNQVEFLVINIVGTLLCLGLVGLVAGLFLGLLTLDVIDLQIIERASIDEDEKLYAATVLPLVSNRHQLLVTLLLVNSLAYETLPIFLDQLVPSWVAILLSTTLVMFFGEILPMGIFSGPHQLYLGSLLAPVTRFFLYIMWPFATPLAMMMDYLVHEEGDNIPTEVYNRGELSALVRIQFEQVTASKVIKRKRQRDDSWIALKQEIIEKAQKMESSRDTADAHDTEETVPDPAEALAPPLHPTEVSLIEGALQMKTRLAMDVFTPLSHVYSISDELVLDREGFTDIYRSGYSRVPVYRECDSDPDDKTRILGFLMVRQLMLVDWEHKREVSTLPLQRPTCVSPRMNLVDLLRILISHGHLMCFVCARPDLGNKALDATQPLPSDAGFMGIVTLQDIMESILQDRIYDEWDIKDRDRAVATLTRWAATKVQSFMVRQAHERRQMRKRNSKLFEARSMDSVDGYPDESAPLLAHQDGSNSSSHYV